MKNEKKRATLVYMEQHKKLSPQFFFLSIGVLVSLIASVSAFLSLVFETLNHAFPDVLTSTYQYGYNTYNFEGIRSALALLIIVFPVFLVVTKFWLKASRHALSHWDEVLRRWALYLIIFLSSVTIVVDLVTLVRYFVSGEITTRFLLKVAITLVVSALVGWHYVRQLKRSLGKGDPKNTFFSVIAAVLVLGAIIYSFSVIGSPTSQRNLRLDQRRVEDLQSIQWQVISYWQQKEMLPETLEAFNNPISSFMVPRDPEFEKGRVYEYQKLGDRAFELCATFTLPMPAGWQEFGGSGIYPMRDIAISSEPAVYRGGGMSENWDHQEGRTCYQREIDPELYPPYPKPVR